MDPKKVYADAVLFRDFSNYSIGPHTDHPNFVMNFLFYLPENHDSAHLGTSVYQVKDSRLLPHLSHDHYSFEIFDRLYTAPYAPNSAFGFIRSSKSFHGVEPIGEQTHPRNLLSFSLVKAS